MGEGINVRFAGTLQQFIRDRVGNKGLYGSASEYIRDLVRRDYEREEELKWAWLRHELKAGTEADETHFIPLDADAVLRKAKACEQLMPARIFAPSETRLLEIWDSTREKWGEKQANTYVRALIEAIHSLGGQQHLWRPVGDQALGGLWYVRHEHQYVFFRQLCGGVIGVITILHGNMDLPARLKEDNKLAEGP